MRMLFIMDERESRNMSPILIGERVKHGSSRLGTWRGQSVRSTHVVYRCIVRVSASPCINKMLAASARPPGECEARADTIPPAGDGASLETPPGMKFFMCLRMADWMWLS